MSVQMVLLPVFVLVGLTFFLLLWMAGARRGALVGGETKIRDIALGQPNWPARATQIGTRHWTPRSRASQKSPNPQIPRP